MTRIRLHRYSSQMYYEARTRLLFLLNIHYNITITRFVVTVHNTRYESCQEVLGEDRARIGLRRSSNLFVDKAYAKLRIQNYNLLANIRYHPVV
jgi:hypothetical protein